MKETGDQRDHRGSWRVEKKRKETGEHRVGGSRRGSGRAVLSPHVVSLMH